MKYTRRSLGKLALAATPGVAAFAAKPDSKFGGVDIGVIAPYAFQGMANDIDSIIKGCVDLGIDGVELQNAPAEAYAGAPQAPGRGGFGGGGGGRAPGGGRA